MATKHTRSRRSRRRFNNDENDGANAGTQSTVIWQRPTGRSPTPMQQAAEDDVTTMPPSGRPCNPHNLIRPAVLRFVLSTFIQPSVQFDRLV